jgi:hypothetical protein
MAVYGTRKEADTATSASLRCPARFWLATRSLKLFEELVEPDRLLRDIGHIDLNELWWGFGGWCPKTS